MRRHSDKVAYFFIAFALFLLIRAIGGSGREPLLMVFLYISIAISLLSSNIPRVVDIPMHYSYPVRCVEITTFAAAVVCFILLCLRHIL